MNFVWLVCMYEFRLVVLFNTGAVCGYIDVAEEGDNKYRNNNTVADIFLRLLFFNAHL